MSLTCVRYDFLMHTLAQSEENLSLASLKLAGPTHITGKLIACFAFLTVKDYTVFYVIMATIFF
jgi:hypothetical protein